MLKRFTILMLTSFAATASAQPDPALDLYRRTDYRAALKLLPPDSRDGPTLALSGKIYYQLRDYKKSTEVLEKAVAADPDNSGYSHWLGRAFGRRAETSSFLTAPGYASKARQNFEKAVALDPRNLEAMSDLFEYYLQAPGFLGGGFDKAAALAERMKDLEPAEYHYAQARLAEKKQQYGTVEQQLRKAIELAPKQAGRVVDLAKFLAGRGRTQESEAAFHQAEKIAPDSPKVLFEKARIYVEQKRNLDAARRLLERYLASNLTPEDPPRDTAQRLLRQAAGG